MLRTTTTPARLLHASALGSIPIQIDAWIRYLDHKKAAHKEARFRIFERAVKQLPGSYKLWYRYLKERRRAVRGTSPADPARKEVNHAFDRALVFMHKMPRIWIDYLKFLTKQRVITACRQKFDAALLSLPITQHHRIWPLYLAFIKSHDIPETTVRVYRRHLKLDADAAEDYIEYLISIDRLDDAAVKLADVVNREHFVSKKGRTQHELWQWLCELISQNPDKITSLRVDPIIRGGLRRFTDMVGTLWNALADYYVRQGNFEKARDVFEEAVLTVATVRDFSLVYAQFEESALNLALESLGDAPSEDDQIDAEMRMARFEALMDRRPLLLSSVLLRQNPHNCEEWHKRVELYNDNSEMMVRTYTQAVTTVDPSKAQGKLHTLWLAFAKMYESQDDVNEARSILDRAVKVRFAQVEDLAAVWCEYAEMEVRHKNYQRALHLMAGATTPSKEFGTQAAYRDGKIPVQGRVHKSLKLWALYADLEESLGTFETCKAVYDRLLELRIATPQTILNYASFLEEHDHFEQSFTAYERGIAMFKWPIVFEIWDVYLVKFTGRYGGAKLERTRELFEQSISGVTDKYAKQIYMLYAQFEEAHGLSRHAMGVYARACKAVPKVERHAMWSLYIERAAAMFGVTHTRELYSEAIEELPDREARAMCIKFAALERKLGEIDRARAIYSHCSQLCDPRSTQKFWKTWNDFELRHGNEDTFREMLRVKRSVSASYNTTANFSDALAAGAAANAAAAAADDDMAALEAEATEMAKKKIVGGFTVPDSVFGKVAESAAAAEPAAADGGNLGAKDRFKAATGGGM
eukprot:gene11498-11990_t